LERSRARTLQRDRKSNVPVILYAEFTAKPDSESEVQMLDEASFEAHIGADYGAVFNRELSSLIEESASQLTFLTRLDPP
jgi:hypothetical protein